MIEQLIQNADSFINDNLIIVAGGHSSESKDPIPMRLVSMGRVAKIEGGEANLFNLYCGKEKVEQSKQQGEDFEAYWCHYEPGETHYTFLGTAAPLMFTATMNGCSFGIGMPNGSGQVLVGHSNLSGANESGQNAQLASAIKDGTVLTGTFYRGKETKGPDPVSGFPSTLQSLNDATTFGVYKNGEWSFYTMIYCRKTVMFEYINRMTQKPTQGTENRVHYMGGAPICSRRFTFV
jgi:hypothetical protein